MNLASSSSIHTKAITDGTHIPRSGLVNRARVHIRTTPTRYAVRGEKLQRRAYMDEREEYTRRRNFKPERGDVNDLDSQRVDENQLKPDPRGSVHPADMAELMGLGMWTLKGALDPKIEVCAAHVEALLRHHLEQDLSRGPMPSEYRFVDSLQLLDPEKAQKRTLDVPAKGEPGYPRFFLENRMYASRAFRKIHMELAVRQDGMHVFHFVMYPRENFDLPVFSMDMVSFNGNLTLAVCDLCPVHRDKSLPPLYRQGLASIQQDFEVKRDVPEWGQKIFSDLCVLVRPTTAKEVGGFVKYVAASLTLHLKTSYLVDPVDGSQAARLQDIDESLKRYGDCMMENNKTARALEAAFGKEWTEKYMRVVMFDTAT